MENASKALLIAGSILIVILLIAVGMMVFGGAQSNIEGSIASMSSQEKEAFNNQYSMYRGEQKGSTVRTMLGKILANNASETGHTVTVSMGKDSDKKESDEISKIMDGIKNTSNYTVSFGYNEGVINSVEIKDATTTTE